MIQPILKDKLPEVIQLFKENHVKRAFAFGSVVSERFTDESDIDLLITFEEEPDPFVLGERWFDLYFKLQDLFHRKIDLLTEDQLRNPYLIESINESKSLIYGKGN